MAIPSSKSIHSLIIDAGPIIKNNPSTSTLLGQAETIFTIPAVIEEIRDPITKSRIETTLLPFLILRSPRPASIKIITDFARKTGDLEVLSRPDIHLMALAYELECERNHGNWRLRSEPGQGRLNGAAPVSLNGGILAETQPAETSRSSSEPRPAPKLAETRGAWGTAIPVPEEPESVTGILEATHISTLGHGTNEEQKDETNESSEIPGPSEAQDPAPTEAKPELEEVPAVEEAPAIEQPQVSSNDTSDDDEEGWITPSNLKKHQAADANGSSLPQSEPKTMQVALITSDFAMQNVLLRMNLNLLSPSLQRITQLKTWILRCHACFKTTKDMTKQFCGSCGKPTLLRTSCSTDKDGNVKLHLKKNMQWNNRGNVYSIPKPVHGSSNGRLVGGGKGGWGNELILAEDQKEYVNAMTGERRRKEKDLMDEDYLPSILSGDRGRAGGRPKVGAGKNVNSKKRH